MPPYNIKKLGYLENLLVQTVSASSQNYTQSYKTYININQNMYSFDSSHGEKR